MSKIIMNLFNMSRRCVESEQDQNEYGYHCDDCPYDEFCHTIGDSKPSEWSVEDIVDLSKKIEKIYLEEI